MAKLLDPSLDLHAQLEVLAAEGVATSAIEGEKFDPATLRSSLARRLGLPTTGMPAPPRSVEGLVDVLLDATRHYEEPLALTRLCSWLSWFLAQVIVAATASEIVIQHVLRKARFWMRHAQQALNDRQRKALNAILDAGASGYVGGMTNRKYANLTQASAATAQRDLAELVALGCLVPAGGGRSVHYDLPSGVH